MFLFKPFLIAFASAVLVTAIAIGPAAAIQRETAFAPAGADGAQVPTEGDIVLPLHSATDLSPTASKINAATGGGLARAITAAKFAAEPGTTLKLYALGRYDRIILVGLGAGEADRTALENLGAYAIKALGDARTQAAILLPDVRTGGVPADQAAALVAFGVQLAQPAGPSYKSAKSQTDLPGRLTIMTTDKAAAEGARRDFAGRWQPVAEGVAFARRLTGMPGNLLYPESFVDEARKAFGGLGKVSIRVLDVADMKALGMGAILGVGQGSARPPRLLVVDYRGGMRGSAPLALVGKGITFDSGGISIKPAAGMWAMKQDMAGAAAVVGTVLALARREAPVNVVAIAALAENMPDGSAQRPGDVVTTMSGKTIEVLNTDAEGRLVLADALWYAQEQFKPRAMVNLATLTGAVVGALGEDYAGLFTRHDELAGQISAAGQQAGELVWRLPLHPGYDKAIASTIADIKNISGDRLAGAGIGAAVLATFVDTGTVWAHLDIAGMDMRTSADLPTVPSGATGYGVRLLDELSWHVFEGR